MQIRSQCMMCRHFNNHDRGGNTCHAFPLGIPDAIITNAQDHRKPIEGDNGITYERASDVPETMTFPIT